MDAKFGGADLLGHEPVMDLENESIWEYLAATVGAYGYYGRNADVSANIGIVPGLTWMFFISDCG